MVIHIKNLRLRTIIGVNDWERDKPQDVTVNVRAEFDARRAAASDDVSDTVDYKAMKRRIMETVEASRFYLVEKLADTVLQAILEDPKVRRATVEIDKPRALRFADSVSITASAEREP
jgi:FolB domain-containing protein